jgi:hypothetical protein
LGGSPLPISTVLWFCATAYCEGGRQLVSKKNHREIKIGKGGRVKKKIWWRRERKKKYLNEIEKTINSLMNYM